MPRPPHDPFPESRFPSCKIAREAKKNKLINDDDISDEEREAVVMDRDFTALA